MQLSSRDNKFNASGQDSVQYGLLFESELMVWMVVGQEESEREGSFISYYILCEVLNDIKLWNIVVELWNNARMIMKVRTLLEFNISMLVFFSLSNSRSNSLPSSVLMGQVRSDRRNECGFRNFDWCMILACIIIEADWCTHLNVYWFVMNAETD